MKLSLVTLAATAAVANAVTCDLTKVTPLLTNSDVGRCTTESGFSFTPLTAPTTQMLPQICASQACKNVLAAVKALNLGDCTLLGISLEKDLLTPINNACGTSSNSTSSNSTSSNSTAGSTAGNGTAGNGTARNITTTMAPSITTSPAPSSTSSGSGSASPSSTNAPARSSTPTPTPASGASSAALATGAVIVAIAAAIF